MLKAYRELLLLARSRHSYIRTSGWWRTQLEEKPVDANGAPIPWITYGAIDFLEPRLNSAMSVFEFGAGSSTLWWAKRVRSVISCEHDLPWFERISKIAPSNARIIHADRQDGSYAKSAAAAGDLFDVIVIDGRDRVQCAFQSLCALKHDGVVVWDNSDRLQYQPGFDFLLQNGFRKLEFSGLTPLVSFRCSTAVFYRQDNCLQI